MISDDNQIGRRTAPPLCPHLRTPLCPSSSASSPHGSVPRHLIISPYFLTRLPYLTRPLQPCLSLPSACRGLGRRVYALYVPFQPPACALRLPNNPFLTWNPAHRQHVLAPKHPPVSISTIKRPFSTRWRHTPNKSSFAQGRRTGPATSKTTAAPLLPS